jgi:hypothetical protein
MTDDKTRKSVDSDKTVLIRPGSPGAGGATETYNPNRAAATGSAYGSAADETTILGGGSPQSGHQSYGGSPMPNPNADTGPETLRINPQSPLGQAMADSPPQTESEAEGGYTRVIRPSVSPQPGAAGSAGGSAAADLETLQKEGPVVGWFVVVKGPGKGLSRPVYYGNNTIGRDSSQRVPLNFGDDTISSEQQAYLRYDSVDRSYLLIPNLAKSNMVSVNQQRPTEPTKLSHGDIIEVGQTALVFVPLCSADFDWADVEGQ